MKFLISILLLSSLLYAKDADIASKIITTIAIGVTHKENPKIYIYDNYTPYGLTKHTLNLTNNCQDADIVLISAIKGLPNNCFKKILFGTKYSNLQNKDVIGAFFWQKGRPNILFSKENLEKKNIKLSTNLQKYIE